MSRTHAATCQQKMGAYLSHLLGMVLRGISDYNLRATRKLLQI